MAPAKISIILLLGLASANAIPIVSRGYGGQCLKHFDAFKKEHNKEYATSTEHSRRMVNFCRNLKEIDEINSRPGMTWTAGVNRHTDMTPEEFMAHYTMPVSKPQKCSATGPHVSKLVDLAPPAPAAKDWRNATCGETSCVSGIKNQGKCGSCWTFSTVGAMEAVHAINTGTMTLFSEQQLVDCAQGFDNHGCDGGLPSQAFEYILYAGGMARMEDYPYVCGDGHCGDGVGFCKFNSSTGPPMTPAAKVKAVVNFTEGDEKSMMSVVGMHNPVSVAFDVVDDLMHYVGGVYQSTVCNTTDDSVNHAVLAVGYGTEGGLPYWIIKNSWSEGWGDRGYFKILRNKNMCGIATCASFPILEVPVSHTIDQATRGPPRAHLRN